jgi:hypothetical protein
MQATHRLRRRQSALRLAYALALVVVVSCKGTEPVPISIAGNWSGAVPAVSVDVGLTQSGRELSGQVFFHDLGNDALGACEVSGTYIVPSVTLIFSCGDFGPARFDGSTTDARSMTGTMIWGDGRQFSPFTFALTDQ